MTYIVLLSKTVEKELEKMDNNIYKPIINAIIELGNNPRPNGCKKLKGREAYRIRVGNYRIIYEIIDNQLIVDVIVIGHRKEIYKN